MLDEVSDDAGAKNICEWCFFIATGCDHGGTKRSACRVVAKGTGLDFSWGLVEGRERYR